MTVCGVLVLEIGLLDNLPSLHDLCAATKSDFGTPVSIEVCCGELANVMTMGGKRHCVDADAGRMFFLGSRDHVMEDSVHEMLDKCDVGRLVVVPTDAVGTDNASVGIPGH
jgi:hypothetical protein